MAAELEFVVAFHMQPSHIFSTTECISWACWFSSLWTLISCMDLVLYMLNWLQSHTKYINSVSSHRLIDDIHREYLQKCMTRVRKTRVYTALQVSCEVVCLNALLWLFSMRSLGWTATLQNCAPYWRWRRLVKAAVNRRHVKLELQMWMGNPSEEKACQE